MDAAAATAVLTSRQAVPVMDGARRPNTRSPAPGDRMSTRGWNLDAGVEVLLAELGKSLDRVLPAAGGELVDTLGLLSGPIAHSTIAALVPTAGPAARGELVEAALSWLASLGRLIAAARPPRRWSSDVRQERLHRERVQQLLTRAGCEVPVLALAGGGQVPTAAAAWLLELLAHSPDTQAELANGTPGWAAAAVSEALRLYPVNWALPRLIIADVELAGQRLRLASRVLASPLLLGRDRQLFPHADTLGDGYAPQRWLDGARRPGDWLPFGAGARACPGRGLALAQLRALAEFVGTTLRLAPIGAPAQMDGRNGLLPDPHLVRLHRRHPATTQFATAPAKSSAGTG
jgi:cytochrome P450